MSPDVNYKRILLLRIIYSHSWRFCRWFQEQIYINVTILSSIKSASIKLHGWFKVKINPIGSMGLVYLPTWMVGFLYIVMVFMLAKYAASSHLVPWIPIFCSQRNDLWKSTVINLPADRCANFHVDRLATGVVSGTGDVWPGVTGDDRMRSTGEPPLACCIIMKS